MCFWFRDRIFHECEKIPQRLRPGSEATWPQRSWWLTWRIIYPDLFHQGSSGLWFLCFDERDHKVKTHGSSKVYIFQSEVISYVFCDSNAMTDYHTLWGCFESILDCSSYSIIYVKRHSGKVRLGGSFATPLWKETATIKKAEQRWSIKPNINEGLSKQWCT